MFSWILLRLTRLFWTNRSFAHWACSTSMTPLHWYLKFAYVGMLWHSSAWMMMSSYLILHITGAGVLRAGLGAHQEHLVNQDAQAADRKKVPAEVIQVASHEVDTDSDKDESHRGRKRKCEWIGAETTLPLRWPLMLKQYERMQASYAAVGRDFKDQDDFIGSEYRKLQRLEFSSWATAPGETFLLFAKMCWPSWPCVSWVLLGGLCNTGRSQGIAVFYSRGV